MYDVRQFKPAMYALLLLGIVAFAFASSSLLLLILGGGGVLTQLWLSSTGRFRPIPRIIANLITIAAFAFAGLRLLDADARPVLIIGQFLVMLHVIKLFELRANRDWAQLLVLSLLLMVAPAAVTPDLLFGVLLVVYLFLSLYCCLLFHLKVEADAAQKALALPEERTAESALRHDQRFLTRSMRKLTAIVALFAIAAGVATFVFFPRAGRAGALFDLDITPKRNLSGLSDRVGLQDVAEITLSDQIMGRVKVSLNGEPVTGGQMLYVRGQTLNVYSGEDGRIRRMWTKTPSGSAVTRVATSSFAVQLQPPEPGDIYEQEFALQPTGVRQLFTLGGAFEIKVKEDVELRFDPEDQTIRLDDEPLTRPMEYTLRSNRRLNDRRPTIQLTNPFDPRRPDLPTESSIAPGVREYALRSDVTGEQDGTSLGQLRLNHYIQRMNTRSVHPLDDEIASNIVSHLRSEFEYTRDLTDARELFNDKDAILVFLEDTRRGHCEYFAFAMTLMCQSLGMHARVVTGMATDEYNEVGGYYVLRAAHAHAWVEVLTEDGWVSYDPTSGRLADPAPKPSGFWGGIRHLFDHLEQAYSTNVFAYDEEARTGVINTVDRNMDRAADRGRGLLSSIRNWAQWPLFWAVSSKIIGGVLLLALLALIVAVIGYLAERWRLRRRAARIGIEDLPAADQMRLARQLGFYDEMTRLLARHGVHRPAHLTPREFVDTLVYLPSDAVEAIRKLTRVFYRIRFGGRELQPAYQRRVHDAIHDLERTLESTRRIA